MNSEGIPVVEWEESLDELSTFVSTFESEVDPEIEKAFDILGDLEKKLEESKKSLSPDVFAEIVDKIKRKVSSYVRRLIGVSTLVVATLSTEGMRAQGDASIEETQTATGIEYAHNDSVTTHILDYFVGRDTLTDDEVFSLVKSDFRADYEEDSIQVPKNFDQMDIQSFKEFVTSRWLESLRPTSDREREMIRIEVARVIEHELRSIPRFYGFHPDLYIALWQMARQVGAPNIRFMESDTLANRSDDRSYYDPLSHTITLNLVGGNYDSFDTLFEEFAHSMQHAEHPIIANVRKLRDIIVRIKGSLVSHQSTYNTQLEEYDTYGTIEHEAHTFIAPRLKEEFQRNFRHLVASRLK